MHITPRILVAILFFVTATAVLGLDSRGSTTGSMGGMMPMQLVAPLFIEDKDFSTTLVMVNAAKVGELAEVSVRGLDGSVLLTRRVELAPHDQQRLELRTLLKLSGSATTMGSVVVMPSPEAGSAIAAALSITYRGDSEPSYVDEELVMPSMDGSTVLRGVADSGNGSPLLAIASLEGTVQHVEIECLGKDRESFSRIVELGPGETQLTKACESNVGRISDLGTLWNSAKGTSDGPVGIALKSDAMPGSFSAFALTPHIKDNVRFFSAVPFSDPKMVLSATTAFVGVPVGRSAYLSKGRYVPQLTMTNFSTSAVDARIQYARSSEESGDLRDVMMVNVPPKSSKEILLSGLEAGLDLENSFLVTSNASPADLMAKLVAKSDGRLREMEILGKDGKDPQNGGNHPWSLENGSNSLLLLFNHDQRIQSFSVAIASATIVWQKTYKLQAMQTKLIDIAAIVKNHVLDDHGSALRPDIPSGEVYWFNAAGLGKGRILLADAGTALARNYSCGIFATPCSPATLSLIPPTIPRGATSTADFSYQICGAPDQYSCSGPVTSGSNDFPVSWSSQNTSVASAGGGGAIGTVTGEGPGTAEIIATAENNFGTCSVGAGANITVNTPDHLSVVLDNLGFPKCGANQESVYLRQMVMQVVDKTNTAMTENVYVQETQSPAQPQNSCGNGSPNPSGCGLTGTFPTEGIGQFTDNLTVDQTLCVASGKYKAGCGFSVTSTWGACNVSGSNSLWISPRITHVDSVTVDGKSTQWIKGTQCNTTGCH